MPTLTVRAGDNGTIIPSSQVTEIIPGESVVLQAYPHEGYRVRSVIVNGMEKGSLKKIRLDNVLADSTVEVTFAKNLVNRVSVCVLENGVDPHKPKSSTANHGISVSFKVDMPRPEIKANMSVLLYNASNSLRFGIDYDRTLVADYSTVFPSRPSKFQNQHVAPAATASSITVSMRLRGESVEVLAVDNEGFQVLHHSGKLFSGEGSMLMDGWLVAVDGAVEGDYDYPFDISDFCVESDGKKPLTLVGHRSSPTRVIDVMG